MNIRITNIHLSIYALLMVCVLSVFPLRAADVAKGEALFKQHCTACHKVDAKLVGPALKGINEKYKGDEKWLYEWIRNNQKLIKAGDPKAVALYEANGKQQMSVFTFLTDADIADMLAYVAAYVPPKKENTTSGVEVNTDPFADPQIYYAILGLAVLLIGVAVLLVAATAVLAASVRAKDENRALSAEDVGGTIKSFLSNKFVVSMIAIVVLVGSTAKLISAARGVSLHQNYMPTQPIKYSHKLHAGTNQIQCQYCHSGASKSKNAWVPSTNVCMNCHKAIEEGPTYGKAEIAKIYMAAGWNPIADAYLPAGVSADTLAAVFKKWMEDETGAKYPKKIKNVGKAYDEVVASVGFQKPIEWVRVHNLPDHAYFNHAQHISVGGKDKNGNTIECQTCHGPIQEMEVVYQYSPLSMGWCINCHRQSKTTYSFPDPKDPKKTINPSPADMGGLDCVKCHY